MNNNAQNRMNTSPDRRPARRQGAFSQMYGAAGKNYFIVLAATIILIFALLITFFIGLAATAKDKPGTLPNGQKGTPLGTTPAGNYLASGNGAAVSGITSEAAVLVDASTKTVVAGKSTDAIIHPASMTKVMTLLVAVENITNENDKLTVTADELAYIGMHGGSGSIVENAPAVDAQGSGTDANGNLYRIPMLGKSITVKDALYLVVYDSDTVSCLMLAKYVAGSEAEFVALMNKRAKEMGLTKTNFVNCTGITEGASYNTTTCREMAAMMNAAISNPYAKAIISSQTNHKATIYDASQNATGYFISNYPKWLVKADRLNNNTYAGKVTICGGKTGYEDIPTACFVTYGKTSYGKEYISVTVGRITPQGDTNKVNEKTSTEDNKKLYTLYAQ